MVKTVQELPINQEIQEEIMTLAQILNQEGKEEGILIGRQEEHHRSLVRQIQLCQRFRNLEVSSTKELNSQAIEKLEKILETLIPK